jgi:hypothetical protein
VRRLGTLTREEAIEYNLRDGGKEVSIFLATQTGRVLSVRQIIDTILAEMGRPAVIWELGCSAGDISGHYAAEHEVHAVDAVPYAVELAKDRYPSMDVQVAAAEDVEPQPCDILILCEFLEHIVDPTKLVMDWAPLAKYLVIGHPLVRDGWDSEHGHLWAYDEADFRAWFDMAGFTIRDSFTFPMGYEMILGWGSKT